MQKDDNQLTDDEYMLLAWRRSLRGLLHWSDAAVDAWQAQYEVTRSAVGDLMHHETAFYYVAPELIPTECRKSMNPRNLTWITWVIEQILAAAEPECVIDDHYDWTKVGGQIDDVLKDVGYALRDVETYGAQSL